MNRSMHVWKGQCTNEPVRTRMKRSLHLRTGLCMYELVRPHTTVAAYSPVIWVILCVSLKPVVSLPALPIFRVCRPHQNSFISKTCTWTRFPVFQKSKIMRYFKFLSRFFQIVDENPETLILHPPFLSTTSAQKIWFESKKLSLFLTQSVCKSQNKKMISGNLFSQQLFKI